MIRFLTAALLFCLTPLAAIAVPISPFAFDDQAAFDVQLPKSTGGATRDVILGVHGSIEPNDGIRLDDVIRGIHGSIEPNEGITARELGTYGLTNGFDTYVGLAPVTVTVPRLDPQDWLFGVLYSGGAANYVLAKSGVGGLSEITTFGGDSSNPNLIAALTPLGFGADDIRNVDFAQNAFIPIPVPLPATGLLLVAGFAGAAAMAAMRRRSTREPSSRAI